MIADPFGARGMRERVLATWVTAPARFREDANAEEDLALNGYRDRLIVELAQNAADAARRAGAPGRLLLRLAVDEGHGVLVAANTGAPLDADGVQGLATLRASAKRDAGDGGPGDDLPVGRFGVGFSAVLGVTDEPAVLSRTGGVRFAAADTRALLSEAARQEPRLADELARREGHVPVLRLPFETEGSPPEGYDTAVVLPLRDPSAYEVVLRRLTEIDDALLLALPALAEIRVDLPDGASRLLADVDSRWRVWRRTGRHASETLADRPTEERRRRSWQVTWALPRTSSPGPGSVAADVRGASPRPTAVLHAPTPTDEPMDWPGLLIASFPLDSTRRRVAPGPATDTLVEASADLFAEALGDLAGEGRDVLGLVPVGLPVGVVDGAVRARVLELLPGVPILHEARGPGHRAAADDDPTALRPRSAVALEPPAGADDAAVDALAPSVAGLVRAPRAAEAALRRLGVPVLPLAEVIETLPEHDDVARWRTLYTALMPLAADPLVREALARIPVPLADGRVARGPRGLLVPAASGADPGPPVVPGEDRAMPVVPGADRAVALTTLGLRAVHPGAAHELLERLGAVPAGPRAVLEQPAVRAAVEDSPDAEDPEAVADAVLSLVAAAVAAGELTPGELPWLGDLALPDDAGDLAPASSLTLPGSVAAEVLDPDEVGPVAVGTLKQWGAATLAACGVLDDLGLLRIVDLAPDPDAGEPSPVDVLDGFEAWWETVQEAVERADAEPVEAVVPEFWAVRDLDVVRPGAWGAVLARLIRTPAARTALIGPTRVVAGTRSVDVASYTAWWIGRELVDGEGRFADPEAGALITRLLPAAPPEIAGLDGAVRAALGAVRRVEDLDAVAVPAVVGRLADPGTPVGVAELARVTARLGRIAAAVPDPAALVAAPDRVRVVDRVTDDGTRVVAAEEAVVVSDPRHLQRTDLGRPVVVDPAVAEAFAALLDLRWADDEIEGRVAHDGDAAGRLEEVPAEVEALLGTHGLTWCEHDVLRVDGVEVDWWVDDDGLVHAATTEGLARGLARAAGRWASRYAVAELLTDPAAAPDVLTDEAF